MGKNFKMDRHVLNGFHFCISIFWVVISFLLLVISFGFSRNVYAIESNDMDGDGLSFYHEVYIYHTDILLSDTDGDGYSDGDEVAHGYSPRHGDRLLLVDVDSDGDLLNDYWEILLGSDLLNVDSDGDSYEDGHEVLNGFSPVSESYTPVTKSIIVDRSSQKLSYYFGEVILDSFPVSTGLYYTPTPLGEYEVLKKVPVKHYFGANYSFPDTKWNLHFLTQRAGFYIHGAYWHDNFGQPMSHGCVNVAYENMERLYDFSQIGTKVIIQ